MVKLENNSLHHDRRSQIISWGHWFTLFNIFWVIGFGSRYLFIADWPPTFLGRLYAIISCIGHFSFLTFLVYLILIFPLSFIIHSIKWNRILAVIIATIAMTLLLIDIEVFSYFRMHLNFSIWQVLTSSDDNMLNAQWQKLFIFVPFFLVLETVFALWSWRKLRSLNKRRRYFHLVISVFILSFISSHLIHIWADANFYRPITMQRSSLPVSYPLTARHFLEKYGFIKAGNYEMRIEQEGNPFAIAVEYPLGKIKYQATDNCYNLLMIVVDDWYDPEQLSNMPKLQDFASQHIQFTRHYSSSTQNYLGDFSLFYGLDANYYNSILASHKSSVLIDTLTKQHYNFGLFSSEGFAHPLFHYALLSNFSMPDTTRHTNTGTTQLWSNWYADQKQKNNPSAWFSLIQYKINGRDKVNLNSQMKQLDDDIENVIATLQKDDALSNTIIVITAANRLQNHDQHFLKQSLNVPLIIAWPNKNSEVISRPTSHVDIMLTLMQDALNVTTPYKQYSQGENLFTSNQRQWLIAGKENEIAALYPERTIVINGSGYYQIYDTNDKQLHHQKIGLSTFLQLITENRRFMVTN